MRYFIYIYLLLVSLPALAQIPLQPKEKEGDFYVSHFVFQSKENLNSIKLHYYTLGTPKTNNKGEITNAILLLHGTSNSGDRFFTPSFSTALFQPGQPLDSEKYFLIFPDNIGHGKSTKPSDGLRMSFPHYNYADMVQLQYLLVTQGLHIKHLRLVMGWSMGGMHTWLWAENYPHFMDAALPLDSDPVQIAGRNRMVRKMMRDAILNDPSWQNGNYTTPPISMRTVVGIYNMITEGALHLQNEAPSRGLADALLTKSTNDTLPSIDANDFLYAWDASRDYNPSSLLESISVPLTTIKAADDFISPEELQLTPKWISKVKKGKFILVPASVQSNGHRFWLTPALWKQGLVDLLKRS